MLYICPLWLNSQQCGIHHGNRNQKAKVMQSVGSGVAWQGRGGGGKTSTWAFFHILSTLIISVLQQFPARLVRVNKTSAKVKETYKKDIRQTVTSLDPEEAQIEWHNCLRSFSIRKWIKETRFVFFLVQLLHEFTMSHLYTLTHSTLWIQNLENGSSSGTFSSKNNFYL